MSRAMTAKYNGTCPNCSGPIVAGVDRIDYYRRGRISSVTHVDCRIAKERRLERERAEHNAARYLVAEGPVPERPRDAEHVASWGLMPEHGAYSHVVQRWSGSLVIGFATFLGYEWRVCVDAEGESCIE